MQNLWPMRLFLHKSTPDTDSDVLHGYESVKRCCVVEGLWSVCRFNSSSLQAGRHPEGKKWAAMLFISDPVQQNDQHTEWNVWEKIIQRTHWWVTVSLSLSSPAASRLINAGRTFNVWLITERMSEVWVIKWRTRQTRSTEPGLSVHLWLLIASSNCSYIKTWSQHV